MYRVLKEKPEDVQENLDYILFGLESVVRHLPDPDNYSFFDDLTSEYYADFKQAEDSFLDMPESIPNRVLRDDKGLPARSDLYSALTKDSLSCCRKRSAIGVKA